MAEKPFDPEGEDYDYATARRRGLKPQTVPDDDVPHWPSRDPETGMQLKGKRHKTFKLGVDTDKGMGYRLEKRDDGRYYTVPDHAQGGPVLPRK